MFGATGRGRDLAGGGNEIICEAGQWSTNYPLLVWYGRRSNSNSHQRILSNSVIIVHMYFGAINEL